MSFDSTLATATKALVELEKVLKELKAVVTRSAGDDDYEVENAETLRRAKAKNQLTRALPAAEAAVKELGKAWEKEGKNAANKSKLEVVSKRLVLAKTLVPR